MEQQLKEIFDYYKQQESPIEQASLVELLREIQEVVGCIPMDIQEKIATEFNVKQAMIGTIIKLYPSLKASNYKHRIIACTGARCGAKDGIEVFERDGQTIGDSVCDQCGFTIPEGVVPELYLEEIEQK